MRTLRYKDTPEPGIWRPMSASDVANWRKAAYERVAGGRRKVFESRSGGTVRGRGGLLERDVIRVNEATPAAHYGDTAELDAPSRPQGIREARETVQILATDLLAWVREDPALYEQRVRHLAGRLQAAGALGHLTFEDACKQVATLVEKVAVMDAEAGYAQGGYNRAQVLDGRF